MIDLSDIKVGMRIKYIGDYFSFGGAYKVVELESTYINPSDCPNNERGQLAIVEFMNDGTPMFFPLSALSHSDWIKE